MSSPKIGIFWPGDYRSKPNDLARPNAEEAPLVENGMMSLEILSLRRPAHKLGAM
jgi:hypothetical protein